MTATATPTFLTDTSRPAKARGAGRLEMHGVSKNFSKEGNVPAVQDITLNCEPGEFVVVVGPSGCGKSTLLNIAAGMIRADAGTVSLDGRPVDGPGPDRAMVFQEHGLFPWLTAAQNIAFGLKMAGVPRSERDDRVARALNMVHLTHSAQKLVHELSAPLQRSQVPVVIDHMGRVDATRGSDASDFQALLKLLENPRFRVKVSGIDRIDAHAPLAGEGLLKKAIFKIAIQSDEQ